MAADLKVAKAEQQNAVALTAEECRRRMLDQLDAFGRTASHMQGRRTLLRAKRHLIRQCLKELSAEVHPPEQTNNNEQHLLRRIGVYVLPNVEQSVEVGFEQEWQYCIRNWMFVGLRVTSRSNSNNICNLQASGCIHVSESEERGRTDVGVSVVATRSLLFKLQHQNDHYVVCDKLGQTTGGNGLLVVAIDRCQIEHHATVSIRARWDKCSSSTGSLLEDRHSQAYHVASVKPQDCSITVIDIRDLANQANKTYGLGVVKRLVACLQLIHHSRHYTVNSNTDLMAALQALPNMTFVGVNVSDSETGSMVAVLAQPAEWEGLWLRWCAASGHLSVFAWSLAQIESFGKVLASETAIRLERREVSNPQQPVSKLCSISATTPSQITRSLLENLACTSLQY